MSILKALSPRIPVLQSGVVVESMLDGTYRVNIGGTVRRIASSTTAPPQRGAQVVVGVISGKESIISTGQVNNPFLLEVTING